MARTRSPNYPTIDFGSALKAIEPAWKAEQRHKMGRMTLAKHLGYNSLNGRALSKMGAVRAYGLVDGGGDEIRITEDAISCLLAPEGSDVRRAAMERCALRPPLFKEIRGEFPGTPPSPENLRFWLVKKGYSEEAAAVAAKSYLNTIRLVGDSAGAYDSPPNAEEDDAVDLETNAPARSATAPQPIAAPQTPPPAGLRRAVFTLAEGDVTLTFPDDLSPESVSDLQDYLAIFMKKAKREAGLN